MTFFLESGGAALEGRRVPRGPRMDAPGTVHHVMVRGVERREVFRDDRDRDQPRRCHFDPGRLVRAVLRQADRVYYPAAISTYSPFLPVVVQAPPLLV